MNYRDIPWVLIAASALMFSPAHAARSPAMDPQTIDDSYQDTVCRRANREGGWALSGEIKYWMDRKDWETKDDLVKLHRNYLRQEPRFAREASTRAYAEVFPGRTASASEANHLFERARTGVTCLELKTELRAMAEPPRAPSGQIPSPPVASRPPTGVAPPEPPKAALPGGARPPGSSVSFWCGLSTPNCPTISHGGRQYVVDHCAFPLASKKGCDTEAAARLYCASLGYNTGTTDKSKLATNALGLPTWHMGSDEACTRDCNSMGNISCRSNPG